MRIKLPGDVVVDLEQSSMLLILELVIWSGLEGFDWSSIILE